MSGVFVQAAVILLREGLEAMLVIAALAAYLKKAGAGGALSLTGPSPSAHVLRGITYWDGSRWSSYGNEGLGMVNLTSTETVEIRAMARDNRGNLMIGGTFLGSYSGVVSPYLIRTRMGSL